MNDELPQGWTVAALKDLVGPNGMFTDGDWILSEHLRTGNDVRLIQLADVGIGHFLDKSQKFISRETAESLGVTYLQEGDVLISRMADPLARACLFPRIKKSSITAVDVAIARCDTTVTIPAYLMHLCNSHRVHIQAEGAAVGTTRKRISRKNLEQIKAPLAPLNEQRRIVAKLEKSLGKVEICQKRLAKISILLKRFRQSVLAAACSGRLTQNCREKNSENGDLPAEWEWIQLEELLPKGGIFDGPFGSNLKTSDYTDSGIRVIRLENVGHLRFISEKETYISREKYETLKKHTVGEGDIIFASFIDEKIRACLLPKLETAAIAKADCFCLRPKIDMVNCRYLTYQLVSRESYNSLFENVHGATRPRINTTQLRKLEIRICPLAEQREIIHRVEALFALADQIEARYNKAKVYVDKLTRSILAKAFRGELVPQDPSDESAGKLLEHIHTLKSKSKPKAMMKNKKAIAHAQI